MRGHVDLAHVHQDARTHGDPQELEEKRGTKHFEKKLLCFLSLTTRNCIRDANKCQQKVQLASCMVWKRIRSFHPPHSIYSRAKQIKHMTCWFSVLWKAKWLSRRVISSSPRWTDHDEKTSQNVDNPFRRRSNLTLSHFTNNARSFYVLLQMQARAFDKTALSPASATLICESCGAFGFWFIHRRTFMMDALDKPIQKHYEYNYNLYHCNFPLNDISDISVLISFWHNHSQV